MEKEFNGYIFIDPSIEVGDEVTLDKDYANRSKVIVIALGKIFATVRHEDMTWNVMRNRLEKE